MNNETARIAQQDQGKGFSRIHLGPDRKHIYLMCRDGKNIKVPYRTKNIRYPNKIKTVPMSGIMCIACKEATMAVVSKTYFSRDMTTVLRCSEGIRTMTLPNVVRTIWPGSFCKVESLRSVVLNEGLEVLGKNECQSDGETYPGVFQESGLRRVRLPSTLKRIGYKAFMCCKNLRHVSLPEKLEYIGKQCFQESAVESVILPNPLKIIEE